MEKIKSRRKKYKQEKFEISTVSGKYVIKMAGGPIVCRFQMKDQDFFEVQTWFNFFSGVYG
jgi:hypothetical protein